MALTDRQKEIKGLLDQGKTPKEIGQKLGISENAVYQQRRRIKAASANGRKPSGNKRQASRASTSRSSTRQRPRQQSQKQRSNHLSVVGEKQEQKAADPLSEVRRRKAEIDSQLSSAKATLDEATKAHETAQKAYSEAEGKVKPELEQLAAVEALLTGKLKPPKPAQKAKAEKPAEKPAEEAPKPPEQPQEQEQEQEPAPAASGGEIEGEATAQDEAAEAPDEPTEVQPSGNGAGSEERPGVPTLPEFAQEDAFAS